MPKPKHTVREQVAAHIEQETRSVEERIAAALRTSRTFKGALTATELEPILSNVVFTLVASQRFAGIDVPITHNISRMQVTIQRMYADVMCEVHVHEPIIAFIQFQYQLENDPHQDGQLRLKGGTIKVTETTRRLDLAAKAALRMLNVRAIALRELRDPNDIIRRTLPPQLEVHGLDDLCFENIDLTFMDDDTLHVVLRAGT
ncbi:MAG: hypothetical protein IT320_03465 [Anaerolineae bacterium]|nr:hypothetical protein [Anaerolineae bacterium]